MTKPADLVQGTLDLLILRVVSLEPMHGWAIAQRLQHDGFVLGFHTRGEEADAKARFEEVAENGRGHWLVGDLSDRDVGERLVAETVDELGRIDVLVNNAGVTAAKPVLDLDVDDFDALFSVDVRGAFLMSSAAAKRCHCRYRSNRCTAARDRTSSALSDRRRGSRMAAHVLDSCGPSSARGPSARVRI